MVLGIARLSDGAAEKLGNRAGSLLLFQLKSLSDRQANFLSRTKVVVDFPYARRWFVMASNWVGLDIEGLEASEKAVALLKSRQ